MNGAGPVAALEQLGRSTIEGVRRLGRAARLFVALVASLPVAVARPGLVVAQVFSVGVLSLVIILVSGLFVGMVLGLQLFHTLVNFGAEQSLGPDRKSVV